VFTEANGTYSYTVGAVSGYTSSPSSGSVTVTGLAQTVPVTFTPSSSSGQSSYSQALPIATQAAGAGWVLIVAEGVDFTSQPTMTNISNASCPVTGGTGQFPGITTWTGTYSNGYLSQWIFEFYQNASSGPSEKVVWVSGGQATVIGIVSGASCGVSPYALGSGAVDSTTVASALTQNDSAYVAAHPEATAIFALEAVATFYGPSMTGSLWFVVFTTCSPSGGGGTGYNFTAFVNATSAVVLFSESTTGACAPGGLLPGAVSTPHSGTTPGWLPPEQLLLLRDEGVASSARPLSVLR
jgi:hypothetical protein